MENEKQTQQSLKQLILELEEDIRLCRNKIRTTIRRRELVKKLISASPILGLSPKKFLLFLRHTRESFQRKIYRILLKAKVATPAKIKIQRKMLKKELEEKATDERFCHLPGLQCYKGSLLKLTETSHHRQDKKY